MHRSARILSAIVTCALLAGCQTSSSEKLAQQTNGSSLYNGLDGNHFPIATDSGEAQRWFDQGVQLMYGFNHDEAIRSFEVAAALDPESPMPWWGISCAAGMHINNPVMTEAQWRKGFEAAAEARTRVTNNTPPLERALVEAVSARYAWPAPAEQRPYDEAYAAAMERAYERFPDHPDVAALYVESLMNLQPWDYWTEDSQPKGRTADFVAALEKGLKNYPDHPQLTHLYIHAVEASDDPDRALDAADRLCRQVPGAGHLVHMPSHIYVRTGRYPQAADANVRAIRADREYFQEAPEATFYWLYHAHNIHFLAYSAMMEGRYETAIRAARDLERDIPEQFVREFGGVIEGIMPTTFHVQIRFGKWEDILKEPQRADYRLVSHAACHYARAIAYAALNQPAKARQEAALFEQAAANVPDEWYIFNNKAHYSLDIGRQMLEGEIAFREGRQEEAFAALRRGVELEDELIYDEPPGWMLPVRHPLGAFLMSAGRYAEAEDVYREDLKRNRNNGWALLGLQQALVAQGEAAEAMETDRKLATAWKRADIKATSSCLCEPQSRWAVQMTQETGSR